MAYYSKEPKSVIAFDLCTFFHADLIQLEARILTVVIKWHHRANGLLQHWAQKCDQLDLFTFFHTDLIQSEASRKLSSTSDWLMSAWKNVS